MMASRRNLRISIAIAASLGVHFAAATAMTPAGPKVEIEGGATAEIAALGSSFEDLLAGSSAAQPAEVSPAKTTEPVAEPLARPSPDTHKPAHTDQSAKAAPEKAAAAKPAVAPSPSKPVEIARADVTPAPLARSTERLTQPADISRTEPSPVPPSSATEKSAHATPALALA